MHTSDYCRAQSSEVNELAAQARRDVEIRMLESISETWAILAVQIDQYLAAVHVLDKAGGYALQEHGGWLVESIVGSRDNILGLPTEALFPIFTAHRLI